MITVYGVPGSRTMRALWMLEELGVPYENVKTSFTGDTRTPEFLKLNPNGHIPVLQDGDVILWESMAINLYLARKYDKGLWPKSIVEEGHTYKWSLWAITEAEEPIITTLVNRVIFPEPQRDAAKANDAAQRFLPPLKVLDGALAGRDYLVSKDFTVADLNVASVVSWAPMARIDLSASPNVDAWLKRCGARPSYAKMMRLI